MAGRIHNQLINSVSSVKPNYYYMNTFSLPSKIHISIDKLNKDVLWSNCSIVQIKKKLTLSFGRLSPMLALWLKLRWNIKFNKDPSSQVIFAKYGSNLDLWSYNPYVRRSLNKDFNIYNIWLYALNNPLDYSFCNSLPNGPS